MKTLLGTAIILITLVVGGALSHDASRQFAQQVEFGVIEGRVVDKRGQPIADATVVAFSADAPLNGRLPEAHTDNTGAFVLERVKAGINNVHAYKEQDGYPNTIFAVFAIGRDVPVVNIIGGQTTKDVLVRLGPKAGKLAGRVIDANTGRSLKEVEITVFNDDDRNDPYRSFDFSRMVTQTAIGFQVLVPSVPFRVKVSAPDYDTWDGTEGAKQSGVIPKKPDTMLVEPEQIHELMVSLRRTVNQTGRP